MANDKTFLVVTYTTPILHLVANKWVVFEKHGLAPRQTTKDTHLFDTEELGKAFVSAKLKGGL